MSNRGTVCGRCGAKNEIGAQFCMNCGALLAAYVSALASPIEQQRASASASNEPKPPLNQPAIERVEQAIVLSLAGDESVSTDPVELPEPKPTTELLTSASEAQTTDELLTAADDVQTTDSATFLPPSNVPGKTPPETRVSPSAQVTPPVSSDQRPTPVKSFVSVPVEPSSVTDANIESPYVLPASPRAAQVSPPPPFSVPPEISPQPISSGTPPQAWIVLGLVLILISCTMGGMGTVVDLPFFLDAPVWCTFPIGALILIIGVVQLVTRNSRR